MPHYHARFSINIYTYMLFIGYRLRLPLRRYTSAHGAVAAAAMLFITARYAGHLFATPPLFHAAIYAIDYASHIVAFVVITIYG